MKQELGIFATDQFDRHGTCIPASELMAAEERARHAASERGFPPGNPMHIQHDLHRPIGWSQVLGHLIDGAMVRTIGLLNQVETDEEKADLAKLGAEFWQHHHHIGKESLRDELSERVAPASLQGATYHRLEAYAVARSGLAAELYPELFDLTSELVDKDGLTNYRALLTRMKRLQPGVFLDPERGLVLFAHRFFRRSLSHLNKLNDYFLAGFDMTAKESGLNPRLRLDPDLLGHAQTVLHLMEREYWHGPKFSDDVVSIPPGASEHKASERVRFFEGVDKTHFWWKKPEARDQGGTEVVYRTFEVEELIENVSGGLLDERYGCRYAHAEFSPAVSAITHFDGAIRAYPAEVYLERIEKTIDRAGKHSEYTKLFRFDGSLPVQRWKRLLSDFYRGNPLIPEYLGGDGRELETEDDPIAPVDTESARTQNSAGEELCAFISLDHEAVDQTLVIHTQCSRFRDGLEIQAAETGGGAIDTFLRSNVDLANVATLCAIDGVLHLARISFGATETLSENMRVIVDGLAKGLAKDAAALALRKISVALSWPVDRLNVTLSLRGSPEDIETLLSSLLTVIDPLKTPSTWIEPLSVVVRRLSPRQTPTSNLWNVLEGALIYSRPNDVERMLLFTPQLVEQLQAEGLLPDQVDGADAESKG
ncbi:hypothetical protein [Burkholderia ubonensis]|uniref:hypothetical protein n=1 Tax=Burkholderia ubonensis TaxID=101571 RepID=UPI0012F7BF4F|nr:hypothetical protein [Burkholderia ubonensis]